MAYVRAIVGVFCAAALAQLLAPLGKEKKYVELACALLVLAAVASPLANGLSITLPSLDSDETEQTEDTAQSAVIHALEDALKAHLCAELGLSRADVSIEIEGRFEGDSFCPTRVLAEIYGGFDQKEAELVLKNAIVCECEVVVRGR